MVLLGNNKRGIKKSHSTRVRTRIPKADPTKKFKFPVPPRPFNHRRRNVERGVARNEKLHSKVSKIPLQSKSKKMPIQPSRGGHYDHFTEEKISESLFESEKNKYPQFYNRNFKGKFVDRDIPSLGDDLYNKQRIVRPRFVQDKFDEEEDFYDLNVKNKERLKALDGLKPQRIVVEPSYDIERVDRIVNNLAKFRTKPFDFQDEDPRPEIKNSQKNQVFRRSASNLLVGFGGGDKEIFVKKNQIDDRSFFKNPQRYKDWDEKFNFEDYA